MYFEEFNKTKKFKFNLKTIIILSIIIGVIIVFLLYKFNYKFRTAVNNILTLKPSINISLTTLDIAQEDVKLSIGYDKYLAILNQNILTGYNNSNTEEFKNTLNISSPIYYANGKYIVIAESNGKKVCLYEGKNLVYEKEYDGEISKVTVNKNGYVAICMSKSGYRTVIMLNNPQGDEMFSTFLKSTYASDVCISDNNKLMAISEIDTSGIQVLSGIKFVQIDKIKEENYIVNTEKDTDILISKIEFLNNNELTCLSDKNVCIIDEQGNKKQVIDISDKNITNVDISLGKYIVVAKKSSNTIFNTNTDILVYDKDGKEIGKYTLEGTIKELTVKDNVICASIGQQVHFMSATCRPIKKYDADMDVKQIILYDNSNMVALIYRNKIELMNI